MCFKAFLKQINDFRYLNKIIYTFFLLYCESVIFLCCCCCTKKNFLGFVSSNIIMKSSMNVFFSRFNALSPCFISLFAFLILLLTEKNFHDSNLFFFFSCKMKLFPRYIFFLSWEKETRKILKIFYNLLLLLLDKIRKTARRN